MLKPRRRALAFPFPFPAAGLPAGRADGRSVGNSRASGSRSTGIEGSSVW